MTRINWLNIIRVTGLLLVLLYHFKLLGGGFIGVDVFFTLSGYLVTASMIAEFENSGAFRLFAFYKRRINRIYPPLVLSILFSLPFSMLISTDFVTGIGRQIAAALGFVTNYFEILSGGSYEAQMLPHLFVHTWFLAVEIHLCLFWGLFCGCIAWLLKRFYVISPGISLATLRILLFSVSVMGAVFSWLRMQEIYSISVLDPSPAYFDSAARAFPFLLGAASASLFKFRAERKESKICIPALISGIFAVSLMAFLISGLFAAGSLLRFSAEETYRYGLAAASLAAVILIQLAGILHRLAPDIKEPKPLVITADLSYNIYLFHWPLYTVFFYFFWNNLMAAGIAMAVSAVFSALLFYGIEPLVHGKGREMFSGSGVLRAMFSAAVSLIILAAAALSGFVYSRAPEINSLETQLYTGYLYQDVDEIITLQRLTEAINPEPMVIPEKLPAVSRIKMGFVIPGYPQRWDITELEDDVFAVLSGSNNTGILAGVTVIGDSVTLGARRKLIDSIPNCSVDAEGSRQMSNGYNLIMRMQNEFGLREYVVVALGTNQNYNSVQYINKIIEDILPGHRLIFVTPYNGAMDETWNTYQIMQHVRTLPGKYPFVSVADWASLAASQHILLGSDKVHIGGDPTAINMYVDTIIKAINAASMKPAK